MHIFIKSNYPKIGLQKEHQNNFSEIFLKNSEYQISRNIHWNFSIALYINFSNDASLHYHRRHYNPAMMEFHLPIQLNGWLNLIIFQLILPKNICHRCLTGFKYSFNHIQNLVKSNHQVSCMVLFLLQYMFSDPKKFTLRLIRILWNYDFMLRPWALWKNVIEKNTFYLM